MDPARLKFADILVVENDENDVLILKHALKKVAVQNAVHFVADGEQAVDYLKGVMEYQDRRKFPYPTLILTDLKMPRGSGFDLLEWLKKNPVYRVVPTLVMSSSDEPRDVKQAYYLGAAGYFKKPNAPEDMEATLRLILDYWSRAELPL